LTCTGSYEATYDPGLTNTPQAVHLETHSTYSTCLLGGTVTSGSSGISINLPSASCADLLSSTDTGNTTVTWNTAETTTYHWSSTAVDLFGTLISTTTGQVTSGKYLNGQVQRISISPNLQLSNACNSASGLTEESGTVTLTIQSL
jgi:hypothetical protein